MAWSRHRPGARLRPLDYGSLRRKRGEHESRHQNYPRDQSQRYLGVFIELRNQLYNRSRAYEPAVGMTGGEGHSPLLEGDHQGTDTAAGYEQRTSWSQASARPSRVGNRQ